jgi:hypothetical protein
MRRSMKFRPQANQIEAITKRNSWASLAIVGVADSEVMQRMLFACTRLALTVVATWPAQSTQPTERIKQKSRADKVRQLARSYASRVTLLECDADTAAGKLAGQEFDGAVLFDAAELEHVGGAWAALVRSGGMLLGTDHRDIETRAVLNAVAPGWERLDDGLWCVRVKRSAIADSAEPVEHVEEDVIDELAAFEAQPVAPDELPIAAINAVHDPIHSGPALNDDAVHEIAPVVAGAEGLDADEADSLAGHAHVPKGASEDRDEPRVGRTKVNVNRPRAVASKLAPPPEISGSDVHAATIAPKRRGRPRKIKVKVAE